MHVICYTQSHLFRLFLGDESSMNYSSNSKQLRQLAKPNKTTEPDKNGLVFGPHCEDKCFLNKAECNHVFKQVKLNNIGKKVAFPSMWNHHGYYMVQLEKVFFTAQLFAKPSLDATSK
jgi:hypothetical protein